MTDGPWSTEERASVLLEKTAEAYRAWNTVEADPYHTIDVLTRQRDSARSWAVALEARLAQVRELLAEHYDADLSLAPVFALLDSPLPEVQR